MASKMMLVCAEGFGGAVIDRLKKPRANQKLDVATGLVNTSPFACHTRSPTTPESAARPRNFTQEHCPATRVRGHFPAVTSHTPIGLRKLWNFTQEPETLTPIECTERNWSTDDVVLTKVHAAEPELPM